MGQPETALLLLSSSARRFGLKLLLRVVRAEIRNLRTSAIKQLAMRRAIYVTFTFTGPSLKVTSSGNIIQANEETLSGPLVFVFVPSLFVPRFLEPGDISRVRAEAFSCL